MKKLILITILFLSPAVYGQCTGDSQCVPQSVINKAAEVADQLRAANDVILKFQTERGATEAERAAAQALIKGLNDLMATKDRIITEYEHINELYKKVIAFQDQIIQNLERQLSKPKSAWAKFLNAVKTVLTLATGVMIGRAGI